MVLQEQADHMWDFVMNIIRDDLRALWGVWETDIAPRLGPDAPHIVTHMMALVLKTNMCGTRSEHMPNAMSTKNIPT